MNIKKLTMDASRYCQEFNAALREAARYISTGQIPSAKQELQKAIQKETDIENMLMRLRRYELTLFKLTKKEIKDIKR